MTSRSTQPTYGASQRWQDAKRGFLYPLWIAVLALAIGLTINGVWWFVNIPLLAWNVYGVGALIGQQMRFAEEGD